MKAMTSTPATIKIVPSVLIGIQPSRLQILIGKNIQHLLIHSPEAAYLLYHPEFNEITGNFTGSLQEAYRTINRVVQYIAKCYDAQCNLISGIRSENSNCARYLSIERRYLNGHCLFGGTAQNYPIL